MSKVVTIGEIVSGVAGSYASFGGSSPSSKASTMTEKRHQMGDAASSLLRVRGVSCRAPGVWQQPEFLDDEPLL